MKMPDEGLVKAANFDCYAMTQADEDGLKLGLVTDDVDGYDGPTLRANLEKIMTRDVDDHVNSGGEVTGEARDYLMRYRGQLLRVVAHIDSRLSVEPTP